MDHVMEPVYKIIVLLNNEAVGERIKGNTNHNEIALLINGINIVSD